MKIKKQYHDRVINLSHPFIPGGQNKRLGDLKATQVKALYKQGLIDDSVIEVTKPKKDDSQEDNSNDSND